MDDDLHLPPCLLVLSKGAQQISTLPQLLPEYRLQSGVAGDVRHADAVLAWGRKPSAQVASAVAAKAGLPLITVEDGFLRSVGLGADEPPLSLVVDHLGIYYDASTPSRLEQLIARPITAPMESRALALQALWQANKVSKYNAARIEAFETQAPCVLVADQTFGDASLQGAGVVQFRQMLDSALADHPECKVLLKVHPDVMAGRKKGHFDLKALSNDPRIEVLSRDIHPAELLPKMQAVYVMTSQLGFDALLWNVPVSTFGMPFYAGWGLTRDALKALSNDPRIEVLSRDIHPAELLPKMQAVYVMTSQLGFDALLWNVPVSTFGMPFYAGWGLTRDAQPAPDRRSPVSLAQLLHAALIVYPRYISPETGTACTPEVLIEWIGLQRRKRSSLPQALQVLGFTRWKLPLAERFFDGSALRFAKDHEDLDSTTPVLTWGCKHDHELTDRTAVTRVEDGFLRSVGLGASKNRPLSWVVDDTGIYYDATRPSRLEYILQNDQRSPQLLERANALRRAICAAGVTKYNLSGSSWKRPAGVEQVILVTGQVESDASIRFGANSLRSNLQLLKAVRERNPRAWLLYKPHPEVLAGTREQGSDEHQTAQWCNQVIGDAPFHELLDVVDEVHVLTSQSGFEALMRGLPVTTYGQPFYAGWGLTTDVDMHPDVQARRQRRLTLDELVAGTLIEYPTYVSRVTERFTTPEQTLFELQNWNDLPEHGGLPSWQEMTRPWAARFMRLFSLLR